MIFRDGVFLGNRVQSPKPVIGAVFKQVLKYERDGGRAHANDFLVGQMCQFLSYL